MEVVSRSVKDAIDLHDGALHCVEDQIVVDAEDLVPQRRELGIVWDTTGVGVELVSSSSKQGMDVWSCGQVFAFHFVFSRAVSGVDRTLPKERGARRGLAEKERWN